jgi:protein phosphatase
MLRVAEEFHGSHTGRQRRENEDSLYARSPLFAVADGMGGAQAGEIASRIAVETLGGGVPEGDGAVEDRLAQLVHEANERIHELSRTDERRAGMGTTMTAVLVGEDDVTIAHVGDSRAYLYRDGTLARLTRDHSLVEELLAQGKLTPEEASAHPQRSVITRAVGPEASIEVDTQTAAARDGDVFLICSDGLTTMIDEPAIAALLGRAGSLEDAGRALIDAANDAGGRDNITVVLFRVADVGSLAAPETRQHTVAGDDALRTTDVQAALEADQRREARDTVAVATVDRARPRARRLDPIAPGGSAEGDDGRRRRVPRRVRRALIALAVAAFIAVPLGIGGLVAVQSVYFVGTNGDGFVTVFRGLPYELPLGVDLYSENYVSPIPVSLVPRGRRAGVTDQKLRSQDDAYDLVRQLELGQVSAAR